MADPLGMSKEGFISAEHQSTGDQDCCHPFLDLPLPSCKHGLRTWDWRKVSGFLNMVSFFIVCLLVSQLIDNTVGEDRSAENPKWVKLNPGSMIWCISGLNLRKGLIDPQSILADYPGVCISGRAAGWKEIISSRKLSAKPCVFFTFHLFASLPIVQFSPYQSMFVKSPQIFKGKHFVEQHQPSTPEFSGNYFTDLRYSISCVSKE